VTSRVLDDADPLGFVDATDWRPLARVAVEQHPRGNVA